MHGDLSLGGPVWWFMQVLILGTIALSIFVLVDSLTPRRREKVAERLPEPLWVYALVNAAYLLLLVAVQVVPGVQFAAAIAAFATPFALGFDFIYLLRAVFPKPVPEESADGDSADPISS
jgi:membrane associated rhomboid family serine protease